MRAGIYLVVLALVAGCTNDYGAFRFPKNQAAAKAIDAGDAGPTDGGQIPEAAEGPG